MYENLLPLVRRISLTLVNRDMVHAMLTVIAKGKNSKLEMEKIAASVAEKFIKEISKILPGLFEAQVDNFVESILRNNGSDSLTQLAKFSKAYPDKCPRTEDLFDKLEQIATNGEAVDAKHAMVILCKCDEDDRIQNIYNVSLVNRSPLMIWVKIQKSWNGNYRYWNLLAWIIVWFSVKEIPKLLNFWCSIYC